VLNLVEEFVLTSEDRDGIVMGFGILFINQLDRLGMVGSGAPFFEVGHNCKVYLLGRPMLVDFACKVGGELLMLFHDDLGTR
jgi:hypothetical protein